MHRLGLGAAPTSINKEVQLLTRVLRLHGYKPIVRPLTDKPRPRRPLTPEDLDRMEAVAAGSVRLYLRAYAAAALASVTGLGCRGLRGLTWADVDPFAETVAGCRYDKRVRTVLIALEQRRMFVPGRCKRADRVLPLRSWKDGWKSMMDGAELWGVEFRDVQALARLQ